MGPGTTHELRLYDKANQRLYINAAEREAFLRVARTRPAPIGAFALTLVFTGCRISEACVLRGRDLQANVPCLSIRCLKKRNRIVVREVPVPEELVTVIESLTTDPGNFVWPTKTGPVARITAYRWIKAIMDEAGIVGAQASPKGLRHGYGVNATLAGIQIHMLKRWMGHTSIKTTAIYATVIGEEEIQLARKMWRNNFGDPENN